MNSLGPIRKQKGYTQKKLANALGVSRAAVSMWETGASQPDNETLVRLAQLLEVTTDTLLGVLPEQKKTPAAEAEDVTFDDFSYAMYEEGQFLTEEQKTALLNMARQLSQALKNDEEKKD